MAPAFVELAFNRGWNDRLRQRQNYFQHVCLFFFMFSKMENMPTNCKIVNKGPNPLREHASIKYSAWLFCFPWKKIDYVVKSSVWF